MDVELILLGILTAMCARLVAVVLLWRDTKGHRRDTRDLNQTAMALLNAVELLTELRYPTPDIPLKDRKDIDI